MPSTLINILPRIAGHPAAIVAYIFLIIAWILWWRRRAKSDDFLKALGKIPEEKRAAFCRDSGYNYSELAGLSGKERLRLLNRRYRLFAYIASLLAFIALVLLVLAAVLALSNLSAQPKTAAEQRRAIEIIERSRADLQSKLEEQQQCSGFLAQGLMGLRGSASTAARYNADPEIKGLTQQLDNLVTGFETRFGSTHSPEVDLTIRLSRATAAIAAGHYDRALELLPRSEIDALAAKGTQRAETALILSADASALRSEWSIAHTYYSRAFTLNPDNMTAATGVAVSFALWNCLNGNSIDDGKLNLLKVSVITNFDRAIELGERLVKQGKTEQLLYLTGSLANRASMLMLLDQNDKAMRDIDRAQKLCEQMRSQGQAQNARSSLPAILFARANIYLMQQKFNQALQQYDEVEKLSKQMFREGDNSTGAGLLSVIEQNRAAIVLLSRLKEADKNNPPKP